MHTHGDRHRFHQCYFSPFFSSPWTGIPSPTTEYADSAPVRRDKKINPTSTKRVPSRSTCWSDHVLKLTDYHISRHVASTFKSLTKHTTHCDIIIFSLQRALQVPQLCPLFLYFVVCNYLLSRERQETTRLLTVLISRASSQV